MRSSFSSTKSRNKYEARERVVCPVSRMKSIGNKRTRDNSEQLFVYDGKVQAVSFVTYENGQFIANQQALDFLTKTSKSQELQFMGLLGSSSLRNQFITECLRLSKQQIETGIHYNIKQDFQYQKEGIFLYKFAIRKMNKLLYLIGLDQTEQKNGIMLQLLTFLSSGLTIFINQQKRNEQILQRLSCHLTCHLICNNKIVVDQNWMQELETSCEELIMTSFVAQNDCGRNKKMAQLYMQSISSSQARKQHSHFFKAKFFRHLIQNSMSINQKQGDIPLFVKNIYCQLLAEANADYEEFFNQLNFQLLQDPEKLIAELQRQQDKIVHQFNADMLGSQFHSLYLQKLLALVDEHQTKILACIEQNAYEKADYSMENTGEQQETQIYNQAELLQAFEEMKESNLSSHVIMEKVLMLARNAARMNVLGYDEKAKIAQLRAAIDQKWEQLEQVRMEDIKKKEEANEQNLLRQKYEMMQAKASTLQTKICLLSQEILHFKSIITSVPVDEKRKDLQQLQKIQQKNTSLIQFVANTSLQQPEISFIQSKIAKISQSIKQLAFKKQLILQSVQEHQQKL